MTGGPAGDDDADAALGRAWIDGLPAELSAQRRLLTVLLDHSVATPAITALVVGCSLGRGAADALSDVDAALGVDAPPGVAGAQEVASAEAALVGVLGEVGALVDVLQHQVGPVGRDIRRIFAQYADGLQLDLTVMADAEIRRGDAAPDWEWLYRRSPSHDAPAPDGVDRSAYAVSADQVREWTFLGWIALVDLDKYLRRGSLWEAHSRLQTARERIWALWATTSGAMYPWHGLSQVLDHDADDLPPGIEQTVAGLDADDLRRAARASAAVLAKVSGAAADRCGAPVPTAMAAYVTERLSQPTPGTA